jgi:hypothetical protein
MKRLMFASLLFVSTSFANATETGYYSFNFVPDNAAVKPFVVCFVVTNEGPENPFSEQGTIGAASAGPYGFPGGTYNITTAKALSIFMDANIGYPTPEYQYFLTGNVDKDNIAYTRSARYGIAIASQPPPPVDGEARPGARPGGYTIVDTGSFSVAFIGTKGCS